MPGQNIKPSKKANEPENQTDELVNNGAITDIHKEREACRGMRIYMRPWEG